MPVQDRARARPRERVRRREPAPVREREAFRELLFRVREEVRLFDEPRAPPVRLFTVAHAMRSAVFVLRPRRLALRSIFEAIRFCFEL
jgi:hypothetical protein